MLQIQAGKVIDLTVGHGYCKALDTFRALDLMKMITGALPASLRL
jgi:hypothetical protein